MNTPNDSSFWEVKHYEQEALAAIDKIWGNLIPTWVIENWTLETEKVVSSTTWYVQIFLPRKRSLPEGEYWHTCKDGTLLRVHQDNETGLKRYFLTSDFAVTEPELILQVAITQDPQSVVVTQYSDPLTLNFVDFDIPISHPTSLIGKSIIPPPA